jgi:hypothetical protein
VTICFSTLLYTWLSERKTFREAFEIASCLVKRQLDEHFYQEFLVTNQGKLRSQEQDVNRAPASVMTKSHVTKIFLAFAFLHGECPSGANLRLESWFDDKTESFPSRRCILLCSVTLAKTGWAPLECRVIDKFVTLPSYYYETPSRSKRLEARSSFTRSEYGTRTYRHIHRPCPRHKLRYFALAPTENSFISVKILVP